MNLARNKKRIDWIDMAKGYGIIFSIYAHLGYDLLTSWIYSFHMPLFFFISGYLFNDDVDFITLLKKKIKSLLVPYVCLGLPMICVYVIQYHVFSFEGVIDLLLQLIFQQRFLTLWYISVLFIIEFVFFFIRKLIKSEKLILFISLFVLLIGDIYLRTNGIPMLWNIDVCFMAFPFFSIGYICKKNKALDLLCSVKRKLLAAFFALLGSLILWFINMKNFGVCLDMYSNIYGLLPITYACALLGILFVVAVAKMATYMPVKYIGENSILYFAWHQSIAFPFISKFLDITRTSIYGSLFGSTLPRFLGVDLVKIYYTVVTCCLLSICTHIIKKTKLKFMIGKF